MSHARSKAGLIHLVVLTGVVLAAVATGGATAVGHQATPPHTQAATDVTNPDVRSKGPVSNTTSSTTDAGWTMSRANAANTNYINTTGPTNPITARWTFQTDANTFKAGPVVANGTVYFGTSKPQGKLYAVDAWTGEVRWTFGVGDNNSPNNIAVLRDTVYVGGIEGKVYALDAATGDEFWSFPTRGKVFNLKVANRTLYVGDRKRVYALGALRGEEKWTFRESGHPTGLAVKDGTVYATWRYGHVSALDAQSGAVKWNRLASQGQRQWLRGVSVANNLVYVNNWTGYNSNTNVHLFALDTETGKERWGLTKQQTKGFSKFSIPAVRGNTAYFTGKYLQAVNAKTGAERWSERSLRASPVLLNDIGYVRQGKTLHTLNPTTGAYHARFTPPPFNNRGDGFASPMAVFNGSLYMGVGIDARDSGYSGTERTIFYALGTPEFTYRNLSVTPPSPDPGESVTVTATVANTGTGPGQFNATFTIDGKGVNATSGQLAAGASRTVTFTYVFENAGAYTVGIEGQSRNIGVGEATPAPTPTPTPAATATEAVTGEQPTVTTTTTSTPGFGIFALVVAVAVLAVLVSSRN